MEAGLSIPREGPRQADQVGEAMTAINDENKTPELVLAELIDAGDYMRVNNYTMSDLERGIVAEALRVYSSSLEKQASELWATDHPGMNAFQCTAEMKAKYREQVRQYRDRRVVR